MLSIGYLMGVDRSILDARVSEKIYGGRYVPDVQVM
jgi:hypothetical protein